MIEDDLRALAKSGTIPLGKAMDAVAVADTITALRAEVEALRAALAPFAAIEDDWIRGHPEDYPEQTPVWTISDAQADMGDVRRAAALLRDEDGE